MSRGVDFLVGPVLDKAKKKPLVDEPIAISSDDVQAVIEDFGRSGKALYKGIDAAARQLDAIKKIGLTGEALVLLITPKCSRQKNGSYPSQETVQNVLETLFRCLDEYIVKPDGK